MDVDSRYTLVGRMYLGEKHVRAIFFMAFCKAGYYARYVAVKELGTDLWRVTNYFTIKLILSDQVNVLSGGLMALSEREINWEVSVHGLAVSSCRV
ncbi:hypothetical protein [Kiloniella litopenaei]|uniref:hypothetical protein n=1 Tax=Kiloniella litopenaei TaxID=1549748 RepID=UPI003BAC30AF